MQRLIIVVIIIFSIVQGTAQEKGTIDLLTSGKWYAEYFIVDGQKLEYALEIQKKTWILLDPKGTVDYMINGRMTRGNWEYNNVNNILKIFKGSEIQEYKLITITEKKMLVEELGEEKSIIGWRK